jgi:chromosomal replication initiation ATPase DnaA
VVIIVPNDFAAIWIHDNYRDMLIDKFQMAMGHSANVSFEVVDGLGEELVIKKPSKGSAITIEDSYTDRDYVLLLDDVHFLSGKERIQEEFFIRLMSYSNPKNRYFYVVTGRRQK